MCELLNYNIYFFLKILKNSPIFLAINMVIQYHYILMSDCGLMELFCLTG